MSEREWRFYIDDMLRFAEKVRTYSAGIDCRAGLAPACRTGPIAYCQKITKILAAPPGSVF